MSNVIPADGVYRIKISKAALYMELASDGSQVLTNPFNTQNDNQKWYIRGVDGQRDTYKIASFNKQRNLNWKSGGPLDKYEKGYLHGTSEEGAEWIVDFTSSGGPRLTTYMKKNINQFVDSCDTKTAHFWTDNKSGVGQHWSFEPVNESDLNNAHDNNDDNANTNPKAVSSKGFAEKFFPLTLADVKDDEFDIIIVGSGIGGGILANDLYDTNLKMGAGAIKPSDLKDKHPNVDLAPQPKRILLLEKGGLVFHSHCLNTARPAGLAEDRGQQNDTFFHDFKDEYNIFAPTETDEAPKKLDDKEWRGGPMYNLGGRSAAWGLFAPRVHDDVLNTRFPLVSDDLLKEYYDKAEILMMLSSPKTKRIHQHIMDRLNMVKVGEPLGLQWQWGRIASEFHDDRNFDFAEGAYSSIDKIIEIAMSRPKPNGPDKPPVEHERFKTVLNADVRSLRLDDQKNVTGVNVKDAQGRSYTVKVKAGGNVVLAAGSVHSPAILLRTPGISYADLDSSSQNGLRLTDHDIWFYDRSFTYTDPKLRDDYGAMKLQSYCKIGGEIMLLNMSIDASSFLPRGKTTPGSHAQMIFVFMTQSGLVDKSDIKIESDEPKVTMARGRMVRDDQMVVMKNLVAQTMNCLKTTAKIKFEGFTDEADIEGKGIELKRLQLGGVAHELGTLPMKINDSKGYCVDENLMMKPKLCKGVYVCDLSVFPWSPAANPTLTLAALAIRLSRHMNPRRYVQASIQGEDKGAVRVVNHTGKRVKVWLSFRRGDDAAPGQPEPFRILPPGAWTKWDRVPKVPQGLFIYRLNDTDPNEEWFVETPTIMTALPDAVNSILY